MRKWWVWVIVVAVVLLAIPVVALLVIDWNAFKPRIADAVRDATGRELRIDGDIDLSVFPAIALDVSGVHFANAPGAAEPEMATIGNMALDMQLWPLIGGAVKIDRLVLSDFRIVLEVDKSGTPNWEMRPAAEEPKEPAPEEPSGGETRDISIADMRLERGAIIYDDASTGQRVEIVDIALAAALPEPASPFTLEGGMTVNQDPVTVDVVLDSPQKLQQGGAVALQATLAAARIKLGADADFATQPTPSGGGTFDLDIPSVGDLAQWLGRPLDRPDPGPLNIHAVAASEGRALVLQEAVVKGSGLDLQATGRFEAAGDKKIVILDLKSGVLDLARYMPPPAPATAEPPPESVDAGGGLPADPFAGLPTEPFDLAALRGVDADVNIDLGGVKTPDLELGRIMLAVTAKDGLVSLELRPLALYGGDIAASADLDASGDALGMVTRVTVATLDLAQAAAATGQEAVPGSGPGIAGILSAVVDVKGSGANPRALAESLSGRLSVEMPEAVPGSGPGMGIVSQIKATLDLPGAEAQPSLKGSVVFNEEPVEFALTLDPLREVLGADSFAVALSVTSAPVTLSYAGDIRQRPGPGLDGRFDLMVPSLGNLARWLGQPLDGPDPGSLEVQAELATDGQVHSLKQAIVEAAALAAQASGTVDTGKPVPEFHLQASLDRADIDALMPPQEGGGAAPESTAPAAPSQGWSEEPIDFAPLKQANGDIKLAIGTIRYKGLDIGQGELALTLQDGVLKTTLPQLRLAGGEVSLDATVDGSQPAGRIAYQLGGGGLQALPLLQAFADTDRLSGTLEFQAKGEMAGANQKQLVGALDGGGSFAFRDGAINGIDIPGTLRRAGTLNFTEGAQQKTDFSELSGTYTIADGVIDNRDLKMLAPLVRLNGGGTVPMPPRTVDYLVEAKLVASLEGQGGQDSLAGVPIPIKITGSWDKPSYDIDWKGVLSGLDPTQLQNLPSNFKDLGEGFGLEIPGIPGAALPDTGLPGATGTEGETTGGGLLGGATQQLQDLVPGQEPEGEQPAAEQPGAAGATGEAAPEQPAIPQPEDVIEGLFGN